MKRAFQRCAEIACRRRHRAWASKRHRTTPLSVVQARQGANADMKRPGMDASSGRRQISAVLDASACLTYLRREAGAEVVAEVLTPGAYISVVLAEVLSKLAEWGHDPEEAYLEMMNRGLLGGILEVTRLLPEECAAIARLRPMSKDLGLSLATRVSLGAVFPRRHQSFSPAQLAGNVPVVASSARQAGSIPGPGFPTPAAIYSEASSFM